MKNEAIIFLADGFEEIEALTVVNILRRSQIRTGMVSVTGKKEVKGSQGISVIADDIFEQAADAIDSAEVLILPGGKEGTDSLMAHEGLSERLKKFNENGKLLAAVCKAPIVLGKYGILKDRDAVCYPGHEDGLVGARIKQDGVCVSGNVITSRGPGTTADFAFKILEMLCDKAGKEGKEVVAEVKKSALF